ncbi:MAG: helix-turn-helix domain-containing protein [Alphaproteobacteria bacterium]
MTRCGPARVRGKLGGRPRALKDDDIAAARAMLKDLDIPVSNVARRLKVSPVTLYQHFPGGRGGIQDGVTHG